MRVSVYPEYYKGALSGTDIEVFGRFRKNKSRMFLCKDGEVQFFYDKILSDGRNRRGSLNQEVKIFEVNDIAIGLICCLDVQNSELIFKVKEKLANSRCQNKIICVSAYMTHTDWFSGNEVSKVWLGHTLVLSNGCPHGVKSFITDTSCTKTKNLTIKFGETEIINNGYRVDGG